MPIFLSNNQLRLLRLRAQHLIPHQPDATPGVSHVVKAMCGIQAQEAPAAALAIRARSMGLVFSFPNSYVQGERVRTEGTRKGPSLNHPAAPASTRLELPHTGVGERRLVAADVDHARVRDRSIVRTWGQRGTLHLLATEDLGWLLPLFGPIFIAGDQRRREELGLDEDTCARGIRILRDVLGTHGPLTRAEIVEQLATHDLRLEGQARPHLLARAALEGVICFGPDRGTEPTYVLLNDWIDRQRVGHLLSEDACYAELTLRYLNAYGPATLKDLATWSGMPTSKLRSAWQHIADRLMEVDIAGSPAWMLKTHADWLDELSASSLIVRLLPRFDIYLLGYQNRDFVVPPQYAKRVNAGGGILHPTVLVDGLVVGIWKGKRQKGGMDVIVEPFEQLPSEVHPGLEAEVADLERFLNVQASLYVAR